MVTIGNDVPFFMEAYFHANERWKVEEKHSLSLSPDQTILTQRKQFRSLGVPTNGGKRKEKKEKKKDLGTPSDPKDHVIHIHLPLKFGGSFFTPNVVRTHGDDWKRCAILHGSIRPCKWRWKVEEKHSTKERGVGDLIRMWSGRGVHDQAVCKIIHKSLFMWIDLCKWCVYMARHWMHGRDLWCFWETRVLRKVCLLSLSMGIGHMWSGDLDIASPTKEDFKCYQTHVGSPIWGLGAQLRM